MKFEKAKIFSNLLQNNIIEILKFKKKSNKFMIKFLKIIIKSF